MDLVFATIERWVLLIALMFSVVLYVVFRKRDEFSKHAAENTKVTVLVYAFNMLIAIHFYREINQWMQAGYDALGIPHLPADTWDGLPLWVVCILAVIAKDFADYWNHRLMHTTWGWPAHAAHHTDTHVNAFTAYRVHFMEIIVMWTSYIVMLTWLQMPEAIPAVSVFVALHNMYVHIDLDIRHGPFRLLVASPAFHRWHHADTPEAHGKNLANVMPLWDRLFGTYYFPHACDAPMGALKSGIKDKDALDILIYPFRRWYKLTRRAWRRHLQPAQGERPAERLPEIFPGE